MFAALPLLALPVAFYNALAFAMPQGLHSVLAKDEMGRVLLDLRTGSGARWTIEMGDVLVFVSLVILFIELLKSSHSRKTAILNQSLSMALFVVCLVEFLLFPAFATSAFFLITAMVLLDVLAGFIVTFAGVRRDAMG
jgi:hypothetical protein